MPKIRQAVFALFALTLAASLLLSGRPVAAAPATLEPLASCSVIVKNGNFEAQSANWTPTGAGGKPLVTDFNPRAGDYSADLGGLNNTNHSIRQTVTLPKSPVVLTFWWEQWTQETAPSNLNDYLAVNLLRADGSLLAEVARLGVDPDRPPWEQVSFDISAYAGQTVQLEFLARNDSTNPTQFFVDDVTIPGCRVYLPLTRK